MKYLHYCYQFHLLLLLLLLQLLLLLLMFLHVSYYGKKRKEIIYIKLQLILNNIMLCSMYPRYEITIKYDKIRHDTIQNVIYSSLYIYVSLHIFIFPYRKKYDHFREIRLCRTYFLLKLNIQTYHFSFVTLETVFLLMFSESTKLDDKGWFGKVE